MVLEDSPKLLAKKDQQDNLLLETTLSLIMNMTLLLLEPVVQDSELLLVSLRLDSKLPVSLNCSQLGLTLLQPKVESTLPLETCIMTIGDGTFMILLKVVTGLVIKTQSNI